MYSVDISNINELQKISKHLALKLSPPQIVLLEGPLGVGKTQIICFLLESLGISRKDISSPTFSLVNIYKNLKGNEVYHLDLLRLKSQDELESIGFWDIFGKPSFIFVEWWNILKEENLPADWNKLFITMQFKSTNQRTLSYRLVCKGNS